MAEVHKKTRRHKVVHRRLHHDPVKKQEIIDKVDAMLQEESKTEGQGTAVQSQEAPDASSSLAISKYSG